MRLVEGHDIGVANWTAQKLGGEGAFFVPPYTALGIVDKRGVLRGSFVIRAHNSTACELSVYSDGVLTHGAVRSMFRIMFGKLGFSCCLIHTTRTNKAVKRGAIKMGFRFIGPVPDFYGPNDDALQYCMTLNSCRWMKPHGLDLRRQEAA